MDADAYQQYIREARYPAAQGAAGKRGVLMPRRICHDDRTEFTVITIWDGPESIIDSAGPDPGPGRVLPLDEQLLIERDLSVRRYDVYSGLWPGQA
jgi:hypothetical protein